MKSSYRQYSNRKYLAQDDFPEPEVVRIIRVTEEMVSSQGQPAKPKLVLYFQGYQKGHVNNQANGEILERHARKKGSKNPWNPQQWVGLEVTIWADPSVKFGSEVTGGLRFWEPEEDEGEEPPPPKSARSPKVSPPLKGPSLKRRIKPSVVGSASDESASDVMADRLAGNDNPAMRSSIDDDNERRAAAVLRR
jgi:hypothetical protein